MKINGFHTELLSTAVTTTVHTSQPVTSPVTSRTTSTVLTTMTGHITLYYYSLFILFTPFVGLCVLQVLHHTCREYISQLLLYRYVALSAD